MHVLDEAMLVKVFTFSHCEMLTHELKNFVCGVDSRQESEWRLAKSNFKGLNRSASSSNSPCLVNEGT